MILFVREGFSTELLCSKCFKTVSNVLFLTVSQFEHPGWFLRRPFMFEIPKVMTTCYLYSRKEFLHYARCSVMTARNLHLIISITISSFLRMLSVPSALKNSCPLKLSQNYSFWRGSETTELREKTIDSSSLFEAWSNNTDTCTDRNWKYLEIVLGIFGFKRGPHRHAYISTRFARLWAPWASKFVACLERVDDISGHHLQNMVGRSVLSLVRRTEYAVSRVALTVGHGTDYSNLGESKFWMPRARHGKGEQSCF